MNKKPSPRNAKVDLARTMVAKVLIGERKKNMVIAVAHDPREFEIISLISHVAQYGIASFFFGFLNHF